MGKPDLDVAPRQRAGSHVTPHPQLSGKTLDIRCAPSTLLSGLSPSRLFPVSQTNNHFERTSFPNYRGDSGKCDKRSRKISNNGRNVGNDVSPVEGTNLKGTVLKMLYNEQ